MYPPSAVKFKVLLPKSTYHTVFLFKISQTLLFTVAAVALITTLSFGAPPQSHPDLQHSHTSLPCTSCHVSISDTISTSCIGCHQPPEITDPKQHCLTCHQGEYTRFHPDSNVIDACSKCHTNHLVPAHFSHHCQHCHTMNDWGVILRVREPANCKRCHVSESDKCDYSAVQCLFCHDDSEWTRRPFRHSNTIICEICHSPPAQHKSGRCYFCHETEDWATAS